MKRRMLNTEQNNRKEDSLKKKTKKNNFNLPHVVTSTYQQLFISRICRDFPRLFPQGDRTNFLITPRPVSSNLYTEQV